MLLLIGPAVAVIGIVAVVFVMRHKSVEKRSMYSARRSQIEHKVRAARQRTLTPGRRGDKGAKDNFDEAAAAAPAPRLTYEPSAYAAPPVAPPPKKSYAAPAQPAWESEAAVAPPPASPPPFAPPPPAFEPPAYEPPAAEPPAWTPTAAPPELETATSAPAATTTSAGAGASWSIVGETKVGAEPETKKKKKDPGQSGAWTLASGEALGDDLEQGPKKPSAVIAVAQYAVLVVGLVMVLIGVVVMVANSQ
jgi:hypothetical protein